MDYHILREELKNLVEQCKEVRMELNDKKGSDIFDSLDRNRESADIYGNIFGVLHSKETVDRFTELPVTTISADNKEWRKLVNDLRAFLQVYSNSACKNEFENLFKEASYGVTDQLLENVEVLINQVDNELKVQELRCAAVPVQEREIKQVTKDEDGIKPQMVFISHSGKDAVYVEAFVELLQYLGLHEEDVVCTSVDGFGIPLGENIYDWLVEKFQRFELHVIYVLSQNYYSSPACLNEMGAAWAMKQKWDGMLLPGFEFENIDGCIDNRQIALKLDSPDVNHKLGELKDKLVGEFGLRTPSSTGWEKHRDAFVKKVSEIRERELRQLPFGESTVDHTVFPNTPMYDMKLTAEASILLAYASQDVQGQIMIGSDCEGRHVITCSWDFVRQDTPREIARWTGAVELLLSWGLIKLVGRRDKIYEVTNKGHEMAEAIISDNEINVREDPEEYLKDML